MGNHDAAVKDSGVVASRTEYAAYGLNRHASVGDFVPQFDADGNQTLLKTETAVWLVDYNAEKRPVRFTRVEGTSTTVVECAYDFMGRRAYKKIAVNGSVTLRQRYIYRGYLQIAALDLTRAAHPALWYITWESPRGLGGGLDKLQSMFAPQGRAGNVVPASHPTQPVATRPLAIQLNGTWYTYGWDLTKNICEVYGPADYVRTNYSYSPYGEVTISGDVTQPIQWSSEYPDSEIALVYYNYRYYIPENGCWIRRDPLYETASLNCYSYVDNRPITSTDIKGLARLTINDCTSLKVELVTKGFWVMIEQRFLMVPRYIYATASTLLLPLCGKPLINAKKKRKIISNVFHTASRRGLPTVMPHGNPILQVRNTEQFWAY